MCNSYLNKYFLKFLEKSFTKYRYSVCSNLFNMDKNITNNKIGLSIDIIMEKLNQIVPLKLAEPWDNVGLLVKSTKLEIVKNILLTNDLTEIVLKEAIEKKVDLIISYHPPIFQPFKSLNPSLWKEKIILKCIENSISIYSPHTALDAIKDGINDWLLSPFKYKKVEPIKNLFYQKSNMINCIELLVKETEKISQIFEKNKFDIKMTIKNCDSGFLIKIYCDDNTVIKIVSVLFENSFLQEMIKIKKLENYALSNVGMGRVCELIESLTIFEIVNLIKKLIDQPNIRIGFAENHKFETKLQRIAVCAGSGYSILKNCKADLFITGEMSHHEVLDAIHKNTTVLLCEHSNTERGYLKKFSSLLKTTLNDDSLKVMISEIDSDPLKIV